VRIEATILRRHEKSWVNILELVVADEYKDLIKSIPTPEK
jgi:hypothetical protein